MTAPSTSGVLDTCVYLDLDVIGGASLPDRMELTAVTMAALHQGVAMTDDVHIRMRRTEQLAAAIVDFEPIPFDGPAAARYGSLVGLTRAAGRKPKPRRMDLMIAAIASVHGMPLYTRNGHDFVGLESMVDVIVV